MAQAALMLWGWTLAQTPYPIVPDLTLTSAAAPPNALATLLIVLSAIVLAPSLWYLYAACKGRGAAHSLTLSVNSAAPCRLPGAVNSAKGLRL